MTPLERIVHRVLTNTPIGPGSFVLVEIQAAYDLGHEDKLEEYESRIAAQLEATARLQAQIEAEHEKFVKARLLLHRLTALVPGQLLDPYDQDNIHNLDLIQTHALARGFLEETK